MGDNIEVPQFGSQEEAIAAMWRTADEHVLLTSIADPTRRRLFRAGLSSLVDGTNISAWRHNGAQVRDWSLRVVLFRLALDEYAADLGRPDRLPNAPTRRLDNILHYVVIPQWFDRFPQRQSGAPAAGTEHAAARAGGEAPGQGRRNVSPQGSELVLVGFTAEKVQADAARRAEETRLVDTWCRDVTNMERLHAFAVSADRDAPAAIRGANRTAVMDGLMRPMILAEMRATAVTHATACITKAEVLHG